MKIYVIDQAILVVSSGLWGTSMRDSEGPSTELSTLARKTVTVPERSIPFHAVPCPLPQKRG
jgi:hypothetical protein